MSDDCCENCLCSHCLNSEEDDCDCSLGESDCGDWGIYTECASFIERST